jgi:hypothetical protein
MPFSGPSGTSRRHFMAHLAATATTLPALSFIAHVQANAEELKKRQKACILIWLRGGPPTIDIWDLKPDSKNGGEFKPISTKGNLQISEHMPKTAMVMDSLSVVRAMSTREADHDRGRYYMHTAYVPNPTVTHPTFGSVVSYELGRKRAELEIPAFISVQGGTDMGNHSGFLGMNHAPFHVNNSGKVEYAESSMSSERLNQRLKMMSTVEDSFIESQRGESGQAHKDVYQKAVNLMKSKQMAAFKVDDEKQEIQKMYLPDPGAGVAGAAAVPMGMGAGNRFGRSLLMARRLVEAGVPFVEVDFGNYWDLHGNVFQTLKNQNLPVLDAGIAGLTNDLKQRGMLEDTVVVCMGEFARTPRINAGAGRDHWAASWSVMIGGGGLKGGVAVGETDKDGTSVSSSKAYQPGDIWATVAGALGIPLDTVHTSKRGRPMKIANGGTAIQELIS